MSLKRKRESTTFTHQNESLVKQILQHHPYRTIGPWTSSEMKLHQQFARQCGILKWEDMPDRQKTFDTLQMMIENYISQSADADTLFLMFNFWPGDLCNMYQKTIQEDKTYKTVPLGSAKIHTIEFCLRDYPTL